jgi:hypothetical protein
MVETEDHKSYKIDLNAFIDFVSKFIKNETELEEYLNVHVDKIRICLDKIQYLEREAAPSLLVTLQQLELTIPKKGTKPPIKIPGAYDFNYKNRGIALLLGFYDKKDRVKVALDKDVETVDNCFKKLGFEMNHYKNLKRSALEEVLKDYSKRDYSDDDCFACFIFGHGNDKEQIECTDNLYYDLNKIYSIFIDNKSLNGKPKMFFVTCCRGEKNIEIPFEKSQVDKNESLV